MPAWLKRQSAIRKARLVVDRINEIDQMTLRCEVENGASTSTDAIAETIQALCKLHGQVEFVALGTLPNDGKVIEDVRRLA